MNQLEKAIKDKKSETHVKTNLEIEQKHTTDLNKFRKVVKERVDPAAENRFENDIEFLFQNALARNDKNAVALPIMTKFVNRTFVLQNYKLDVSHLIALSAVLNHKSMKDLLVVYLDRCNINDNEFALLLAGFTKINCLRTLVYKENKIG